MGDKSNNRFSVIPCSSMFLIYFSHQDNLDFCNDKCNRGLLVYELNPTDGKLIQAHRFDFIVHKSELENRINQFSKMIASTYIHVLILCRRIDRSM